jgi:predicted ATPase
MLGYVFGAVSTGKTVPMQASFQLIPRIHSHNISVEHFHIFCRINSIFTVLLVKDFTFTIRAVTFGRLVNSGQLP